MRMMGDMEIYTLEEVIDEMVGEKGTPQRTEFDDDVAKSLVAYRVRQAKKNVKKEKYLAVNAQTTNVAVKMK